MTYVEPRDVPQPSYNPNDSGQSPTQAAESAALYKRSGKSKPELVKRYRQRVEMSGKWRKAEKFDETWARLVDTYSLQFFSGDTDSDRIAVAISFSTVNTIGPGVSVNYPTISVNARRPEFEGAADAVEAAVNYWFRHYDWRTETRRVVKDALVVGHGWAKVWWKYLERERPLTAAEQSQHFDAARAQVGDQAEQDPSQAHALPTDDELQGQVPSITTDVVADQPCVERVSWDDMFIDPESTCPGDLGWICQRLVRPLEDVKADPSYNATARRNVKADMGMDPRWRDTVDDNGASHEFSDDIARVTLYEFYDLRLGYYCVFSKAGGDQFLLEPTELPYPYGHPFVYLGNYDVPNRFYDIGDLEAIEPLQHELNAVRSDMMNDRKRYKRKYLGKRDAIDQQGQAALESDRDGAIAWVDQDVDLDKVLIPVPQEPLNAEMYHYSEQIESDIDLVSGVSEYQRGSMSEVRRTATEAAMIQDASNARAADKLAQVEVFLQEIARRVVQLAQKYLTGDHIVQIVGQDGAKQWIPFDITTIQGEFDFLVEAGSTQPQDEATKRQQALQLVQALQPYVGTVVDPASLVTFLLRDGFGMKNADQFLMKQSPEQQGPDEKVIQTINYKDAPPDIKAQMEKEAGFTPSQAWAAAAGQQPPPQGDAEPDPNEPAEVAQGEAPEGDPSALAQSGPNMPPQALLQAQQQQGVPQ